MTAEPEAEAQYELEGQAAPYQGTPGPAVHCVNCNTTYTGDTMSDAAAQYGIHKPTCTTSW